MCQWLRGMVFQRCGEDWSALWKGTFFPSAKCARKLAAFLSRGEAGALVRVHERRGRTALKLIPAATIQYENRVHQQGIEQSGGSSARGSVFRSHFLRADSRNRFFDRVGWRGARRRWTWWRRARRRAFLWRGAFPWRWWPFRRRSHFCRACWRIPWRHFRSRCRQPFQRGHTRRGPPLRATRMATLCRIQFYLPQRFRSSRVGSPFFCSSRINCQSSRSWLFSRLPILLPCQVLSLQSRLLRPAFARLRSRLLLLPPLRRLSEFSGSGLLFVCSPAERRPGAAHGFARRG